MRDYIIVKFKLYVELLCCIVLKDRGNFICVDVYQTEPFVKMLSFNSSVTYMYERLSCITVLCFVKYINRKDVQTNNENIVDQLDRRVMCAGHHVLLAHTISWHIKKTKETKTAKSDHIWLQRHSICRTHYNGRNVQLGLYELVIAVGFCKRVYYHGIIIIQCNALRFEMKLSTILHCHRIASIMTISFTFLHYL